jgi:hypothetical protein
VARHVFVLRSDIDALGEKLLDEIVDFRRPVQNGITSLKWNAEGRQLTGVEEGTGEVIDSRCPVENGFPILK